VPFSFRSTVAGGTGLFRFRGRGDGRGVSRRFGRSSGPSYEGDVWPKPRGERASHVIALASDTTALSTAPARRHPVDRRRDQVVLSARGPARRAAGPGRAERRARGCDCGRQDRVSASGPPAGASRRIGWASIRGRRVMLEPGRN